MSSSTYEAPEPHAFRWGRNYTSADAGRDGQLGRGFRHSFEHRLSVGLDQVIYTDARGRAVEIPLPGADEEETFGGGCVLEVRDDGATITYEIARAGEPTLAFTRERRAGAEPRLARMHAPDVQIDLHYDDRGHLTGLTEVSEQAAIKTRFTLDDCGRIVEVGRGPRSAREIPLIAAYAYDPAGCLVVFQDALGAQASYAYDAAHRIVRMTDRNGYSFHFVYDEQGRCIEEHGDDGLWRVALRYAPEQRRTFVTEADGGEWIYEYDENQTLIAIHDPYGGKRQLVLDDEGKVVSERRPRRPHPAALSVRRGGRELWPRRSLRLLPSAAGRGTQPAQPARPSRGAHGAGAAVRQRARCRCARQRPGS